MNLALISHQETENGKEATRLLLSPNLKSPTSGAFFASQPDPDRYFYGLAVDTYRSIGFEIGRYLDFEEGFSQHEFDAALRCPFIHLSGGNTFRFLDSIRKRGAESRLIEYAKNGGTLIGVGAGAMILTPCIESASICGDENQVDKDVVTMKALSWLNP